MTTATAHRPVSLFWYYWDWRPSRALVWTLLGLGVVGVFLGAYLGDSLAVLIGVLGMVMGLVCQTIRECKVRLG